MAAREAEEDEAAAVPPPEAEEELADPDPDLGEVRQILHT